MSFQGRLLSSAIVLSLGLGIVACTDRDPGVRLPPSSLDGSVSGEDASIADAGSRPDRAPYDAGVCVDDVDVVFVLDVSSSMDFVLDSLASDISQVVDAARELAPEPHFGFIGFADNHAFATNGPLEGGRVHTDASTLSAAFRQFLSTYTNWNRNPGDGPSGPNTQNPVCEENSLDAVYAAATEFPWRESATRVIIVATDDTFLERSDNYGDRDGDGDTTSTNYPREGNYPALRTLEETVAAVRAARARVFSFTRTSAPGPFELVCDTPRRMEWSHVSDGWSTPYQGAAPLPEATDGRNFDLMMVRRNQLSLAATINEVVVDSYCEPPLW